jgi:hypothetical protein
MTEHVHQPVPGRDDDALLRQAVELSQQCPPSPPFLPRRSGAAPLVMTGLRPEQLTQNGLAAWQASLVKAVGALRGVRVGGSHLCPPGSRAFHLDSWLALGPPSAFFAGTEFAHVHPEYDGSVHLFLPPTVAHHAREQGRAMLVPSGALLVFGPRDLDETKVVLALLIQGYHYARGTAE